MKKVSLRALRPRKAISGTNHWLETLAFDMTVVYHYKEWLLSLSYPERPAAPLLCNCRKAWPFRRTRRACRGKTLKICVFQFCAQKLLHSACRKR